MQIPRFGMKSLLILFAAVALWLSTFVQYTGAHDFRYAMKLAVAIVSAAASASSVGAGRYYWGGFAATMLALCWREAQGPMRDFALGYQLCAQLMEYASKGSTQGP